MKVEVSEIIAAWNQMHSIDVEPYFKTNGSIQLVRDSASQIGTFVGEFQPGDGRFYEELSQYDWYYDPYKWEFHAASKLIDLGCSILDVGAGDGGFLEICLEKGHQRDKLFGLELNRAAARKGADKGLSVTDEDIKQHLIRCGCKYDVVTAFQVLEHVPDPIDFLKQLHHAADENGRIVLAVPNWDTIFGRQEFNLLDMPPHHCSRWDLSSFQRIAEIMNWKLNQVFYEPLRKDHVGWWLSLQLQGFKRKSPLIYRCLNKKPVIRLLDKVVTFFRRFIRGHTIMVVFGK